MDLHTAWHGVSACPLQPSLPNNSECKKENFIFRLSQAVQSPCDGRSCSSIQLLGEKGSSQDLRHKGGC